MGFEGGIVLDLLKKYNTDNTNHLNWIMEIENERYGIRRILKLLKCAGMEQSFEQDKTRKNQSIFFSHCLSITIE